MKPDWKDAPEWANWLAMDANGKWVWHASKPEKSYGGWSATGWYEVAKVKNYYNSLEQRP